MAETDLNYDVRKRWAMMQLQNANSAAPTTGIGALARALQGAMGGYAAYQADLADKADMANAVNSFPGFGSGAGAPAMPADTSSPTPAQPGTSPSPQPPQPLPPQASQQPEQVTAGTMDAGVPSAPARAPVMPSARVWGDKEAEAAGLYEPPAGGQRSIPAAPAGVREFVTRNINSSNPAVRALALHTLQQYGGPKDQWVQQRNSDGSIYQKNLTTGEMKAVEKSDVLPQAAVDQKVAIAAAGKPVTTIDQRAPDEFEKEYGTGMGKRALDVISQGDAATQDLQQSALSRSFLSKIKTGAITPTQATVGAWAKAVGIDPAKLGIDPNLPAVSQAAQSAMAQQTVGMIGAGGFPANNFSDADRKFLNSIPANISNTPEANELLADVRDKVAQRKIDRANAWADARANKQSYETFERDWRKKVAGEDIFADVRAKVDAMQGGSWSDVGGVKIRRKQ